MPRNPARGSSQCVGTPEWNPLQGPSRIHDACPRTEDRLMASLRGRGPWTRFVGSLRNQYHTDRPDQDKKGPVGRARNRYKG